MQKISRYIYFPSSNIYYYAGTNAIVKSSYPTFVSKSLNDYLIVRQLGSIVDSSITIFFDRRRATGFYDIVVLYS